MSHFIDAHCHLDYFEDKVSAIIKAAGEAGVKTIITNGTDPISNRKSLELAATYPSVKAALGIYPFEQKPDFDIDAVLVFIDNNRV